MDIIGWQRNTRFKKLLVWNRAGKRRRQTGLNKKAKRRNKMRIWKLKLLGIFQRAYNLGKSKWEKAKTLSKWKAKWISIHLLETKWFYIFKHWHLCTNGLLKYSQPDRHPKNLNKSTNIWICLRATWFNWKLSSTHLLIHMTLVQIP